MHFVTYYSEKLFQDKTSSLQEYQNLVDKFQANTSPISHNSIVRSENERQEYSPMENSSTDNTPNFF